ncbi:MAG TPA: hypothetical protein VGN17_17100 [Bryobacteraceae bacterium]|jgi:hypothetical protein
MVALGKLVRWYFGFQALFCAALLIGQPYVFWKLAASGAIDQEKLHNGVLGTAILSPLLLGATIVFGMAWRNLAKGTRSARGWAVAASLLSLPFIGIGTVAGLFGLAAFSRPETVAQLAAPVRPKVPRRSGDGTSKVSETIAGGTALIGAVAGTIWWGHWGSTHDLPGHTFVWYMVQIEIASLLSIGFHELGHVFGGWASDMKLRSLVVGPFEWRVRANTWEFKFQQAHFLSARGATGLVPEHLGNLRSRQVFSIAAGPTASLLTGSVALIATLTSKGAPWEPVWNMLSLLATFSLLGFAANLIPMRPQDQYSDGAQIYQILSRGPWADVHAASSMVASTMVTSLRPRDLDIAVIERARAFLTTGREAMLLRLYAYLYYLDSGRDSEALRAMAEAEGVYDDVAALIPAPLHTDLVFGNALLRRDARAARLWWQRMEAKKVPAMNADYWRARAALLWIENQREQAEQAFEKGLALVPKSAAGAYEFDRWSFAQLRAAMDASTPPPLPAAPLYTEMAVLLPA